MHMHLTIASLPAANGGEMQAEDVMGTVPAF